MRRHDSQCLYGAQVMSYPLFVAARVASVVLGLAVIGCGSSANEMTADAPPCVPPTDGSAPTYTELYTNYFADGMPGHCAKSGCHLTDVHGWACGTTKDSCYQGMVGVGLVDPSNPTASVLANAKSSPLNWINPDGPMPQDAPKPFPAGRDAILAWVAACALNN